MRISDTGIALIKKFEGYSLTAYRCPAGVWTIGYGHTGGVKKGDYITREQAEKLLREDLRAFERGVRSRLTVDVNQNQFDALVSFAYNVGVIALSKSTLLRKLNSGDFEGAAAEFPRWNKASGKVLKGLVKRRKAEQDLFLVS